MTILVCPLSQVLQMVAEHAPERIVSLLDPGMTFPNAGPAYAERHLRLKFHDAHNATFGMIPPTAQHVDTLLDFLTGWSRQAPILIHCRAGIGRSTATAFVTACLHNPQADEMEIAKVLRQTSANARPNETLVSLADAALGRSGRMIRAIEQTGRNLPWLTVGENIPFALPDIF